MILTSHLATSARDPALYVSDYSVGLPATRGLRPAPAASIVLPPTTSSSSARTTTSEGVPWKSCSSFSAQRLWHSC